MAHFIAVMSYIILIYFAALCAVFTLLLMTSLKYILQQYYQVKLGNTHDIVNLISSTPILTVLIPCYNEKYRVIDSVLSVINSTFKTLEIILIDDDSTDDTRMILADVFQLYEVPVVIKQTIAARPVKKVYKSQLYPNLMVIHKEHGYGNGADSLNVGVNACQTPLYMTLDADTIVEPEAICYLLFAFFSQPHCVVVGGAVYVLNEIPVKLGVMSRPFIQKKHVAAFQALEYIRSFLFGRASFNFFGGALCYAGAFTLFEKQAVIECGGYDPRNFSYDAEIVIKIHKMMRSKKYPHTLYFDSNAFSWTIVPNNTKAFWKQRNFWQRGMFKSFMMHKEMLLNPSYGWVGMFSVPVNLLFEIMAPVVEFVSYLLVVLAFIYNIGALKPIFLALIIAWGFAAYINLANFVLNLITFRKLEGRGDILRVCYLVLIEMIGFRQLRSMCGTFAMIEYIINRFRGKYL